MSEKEKALCDQAKRDLEIELAEIKEAYSQQIYDAWRDYYLRVKEIKEEMVGRVE